MNEDFNFFEFNVAIFPGEFIGRNSGDLLGGKLWWLLLDLARERLSRIS